MLDPDCLYRTTSAQRAAVPIPDFDEEDKFGNSTRQDQLAFL
jgi:hypothetical protein